MREFICIDQLKATHSPLSSEDSTTSSNNNSNTTITSNTSDNTIASNSSNISDSNTVDSNNTLTASISKAGTNININFSFDEDEENKGEEDAKNNEIFIAESNISAHDIASIKTDNNSMIAQPQSLISETRFSSKSDRRYSNPAIVITRAPSPPYQSPVTPVQPHLMPPATPPPPYSSFSITKSGSPIKDADVPKTTAAENVAMSSTSAAQMLQRAMIFEANERYVG